MRVRGDGGATVRYAVHDYPRRGTVYPVANLGGWLPMEIMFWALAGYEAFADEFATILSRQMNG